MLFTARHEEVCRSLSRFVAGEINPHVDQRQAGNTFPVAEGRLPATLG